MTALSKIHPGPMFKTLKKLFGKRDEGTVQTMPEPRTASRSPFAASTADHSVKSPNGETQMRSAAPAATGSRLALPLRSVLAKLPPELSGRVRQMDVGEAEVFIPMQKVLSQLATGAVRIYYGELRQASPPGTFAPENDKDRVVVDLPLQEILARVNPGLLARRPAQKIVEVPPEVTGPFSGQTRVVISNSAPVRGVEAHPSKPVAAPEDTTFKRAGAAPAPVRVAPPAPKAAPVAPMAAPLAPAAAISMNPTAMPSNGHAPTAPARPVAPVAATPPQAQPAGADIFKRNGAPTAQPVPQPRPAAPVAPLAAAPANVIPAPAMPPVAPARPAMPAAAPKPQPAAEDVFRRNGAIPAQHVPQVARPAAHVAPAIPMASSVAEAAAATHQSDVIPLSPALKNLAGFKPAPPQAAPVPMAPPVEEMQPIRFDPIGQPGPVVEEFVAAAPIAFTPPVEEAPVVVPVVAAAPEEPAETRFLNIKLADISTAWPDLIQQESESVSAPNALVALPFGKVEAAMKAGKLAFPWSVVRSWIKPAIPPMVSPHDATFLDLPLKVIAPLFLAEMRGTKGAPKKVSMAEDIPNLFSGGSVAAPAPATPATVPAVVDVRQQETKSPETNYYVKNEDGAVNPSLDPAMFVKKGSKIGTSFLQRYATPNDIVAKASSLPGVGGSLIALPDGLLVAAKIPTDMNADTLAGFLPAIFGKLSQTTKELRMGELNNLNFTVGNTPWKIFRVGAIYFAAFGIAGQPMPTAQLAGLAAELDRKPSK